MVPQTPLGEVPELCPDLATWGKTLFALPKFRDLKLSYKGFLIRAWQDTNMLSYIRWLRNSYHFEAKTPKNGKASDFVAYVIAVAYPAAERLEFLESQKRVLVQED